MFRVNTPSVLSMKILWDTVVGLGGNYMGTNRLLIGKPCTSISIRYKTGWFMTGSVPMMVTFAEGRNWEGDSDFENISFWSQWLSEFLLLLQVPKSAICIDHVIKIYYLLVPGKNEKSILLSPGKRKQTYLTLPFLCQHLLSAGLYFAVNLVSIAG